jgi:hypothetical protein
LKYTLRNAATSAVLLRALTFLSPGELRELRVGDPTVFELIANTIMQHKNRPRDRAGDESNVSTGEVVLRALESFSTVATTSTNAGQPWCGTVSVFTLMERYKDTITEIDCLFVVDVTPGVNWSDHANRALRSCTRLEILTHADTFALNAWLGLSQLHTLGGVSLSDISFAAIAAAFPLLHTLSCFTTPTTYRGSAVGFFEDLLPRLRSFRFTGTWPESRAFHSTTTKTPFANHHFKTCPYSGSWLYTATATRGSTLTSLAASWARSQRYCTFHTEMSNAYQ